MQHAKQRADEVKNLLTTLRKFHSVRGLVEALRFEGQFSDQSENIVAPGEYQSFRRTEATHRYLFLSPMPQTSAQIAEALKRGRIKSNAVDEYKAQDSCLYNGKKSGRFRKYGVGGYWTVVR